MTTVDFFRNHLKHLGFKKRGNSFYRATEYGTQWISFVRLRSFDQYYIALGVDYNAIELTFKVTSAEKCPLQTEVKTIASMKGVMFDEEKFTSNIDREYLWQVSPRIISMIEEWFDKWSDPADVRTWIDSDLKKWPLSAIWPQARELFGLKPRA
ncbi:MAG: DUF4304 domain-containing protein [Armatimonadetes bacterium]|nr:DUF4304 domain-containing protein [Armatimonadota bacterium]